MESLGEILKVSCFARDNLGLWLSRCVRFQHFETFVSLNSYQPLENLNV